MGGGSSSSCATPTSEELKVLTKLQQEHGKLPRAMEYHYHHLRSNFQLNLRTQGLEFATFVASKEWLSILKVHSQPIRSPMRRSPGGPMMTPKQFSALSEDLPPLEIDANNRAPPSILTLERPAQVSGSRSPSRRFTPPDLLEEDLRLGPRRGSGVFSVT